jgi:hypothetical protein
MMSPSTGAQPVSERESSIMVMFSELGKVQVARHAGVSYGAWLSAAAESTQFARASLRDYTAMLIQELQTNRHARYIAITVIQRRNAAVTMMLKLVAKRLGRRAARGEEPRAFW